MHLLKHRKLIRAKLLPILIITFIWLVADNLLEFVFPTYLENLDKSYFEIGLLLSLASISGILIDLPMGNLSDKASRKRLMISGLILSVIAAILIFSFEGNITLTIAFLFWGMAYQIWKVPRDAKFASLTDKIERGQDYGLDTEVKYLGQTVGAFVGGFVLLYFGFTGILSFYIVFLLLAVLIIAYYIKENKKENIEKAIVSCSKYSSLLSDLKEFKVFGLFGIILLFFSLLFTLWEQILWTFEPLFYGPEVLNIPIELGGLLLAFFSLPGIFLSYPAGRIADRVGKKIVLFLGLVIIGVSLILFSLSHSLIFVFALALLISVGWAISLPSLDGLIIDLTYRQKKGEATGLCEGGVIYSYLSIIAARPRAHLLDKFSLSLITFSKDF